MSADTLYGVHAIERLLKQSPHLIYQLILIEGRLNSRQQTLLDQAKNLGVQTRFESKSFFSKMDAVHQGVMAKVAPQAEFSESDLLDLVEQSANCLILFLDEIQDPHNLGAILRTADATGVDAVVIPKNNSVGLNATVRKVASGAAETVRLVAVTNLSRTLKSLQFSGSLGLVMGAEGSGLRQLTRQTCDELVAIPMLGQVESLNVSVATAVALYEIQRQKQVF